MDTPQVFFSIVTAAYNTEATIARAIESLNTQSCLDWEHLIIDGASTDQTLNEVHRFKDEKRRVLSEPDKGIYDAMNKGIQAAKGKYLFFLNSDDFFHSNDALAKVKESIEKCGRPEMWSAAVHKKYQDPDYTVLSNKPLEARLLAEGKPPPHQATFVQKATFDRLGYFSLDYKSAGDFEWHCRACKEQVSYGHSPKVVVCDFAPGGMSSVNPIGRVETQNIIREYFGFWASRKYYFREVLLGTYAKKSLHTLGLKNLHARLLRKKQKKNTL